MGPKYAKGKRAWGICGRSGRRMLLNDMVFDGRFPNMRVDPAWWEPKHPLEKLPKIEDPIALWRPAPEGGGIESVTINLWEADEEFNILDSGALSFVQSAQDIVIEDAAAQVAVVGALCASDPAFTSPSGASKDFFFPPGVIAGDLMVAFVTRWNSSGIAADQPNWPSGWRLLQSRVGETPITNLANASTGSYVHVAWKEANGIEDRLTVSVTNWNAIGGCVYAFRGQWAGPNKLPQILFSEIIDSTLADNQYGRATTEHLQEIHENSVVLAIACSSGGGLSNSDQFDLMTNYDSFTASNIVKSGESPWGSFWARVYQPSSYTETENLFPRSRLNLSGDWTLNGVTMVEPDTQADVSFTRIAQLGTTARHEITKSVNLVAGQRYSFAVRAQCEDFQWLTINDGSERGYFFQATTSAIQPARTQIGSGTIPFNLSTAPGGSSQSTGLFGISFVSAVTGAVTFSIGLSSADGVQSNLGNTGRTMEIEQLLLYRGFRKQAPMSRLVTTGSAVQNLRGFAGRMTTGVGVTNEVQSLMNWTIEVRAAGSSPAPCKLQEGYARIAGLMHPSDTLGLRPSVPSIDSATVQYRTNKAAIPSSWGASGRYYFEFTINVIDSEASVDSWRVGYSTFERTPTGIGVGSYGNIGDDATEGAILRGVSNTFRTKVGNSDVDTAGAPFLVGDIIGCAVDFANSQYSFYRNGVIIGSARSFTNKQIPLVASMALSTSGSTTRDFTFNFTGPFGGRKPSGFSAYDFENEVF